MADDLEKTEEPTQKKIDDARAEGNVPKSQDASGVATLLVSILAFLLMFSYMAEHIEKLSKHYFGLMGRDINKELVLDIIIISIREFFLIVLPLTFAVAIAGILGSVMQFGFLFTTKPITPDLTKLDPIKGFKNLFSLKKLIDSLKITLKSFTTLGVGFFLFFLFIKELPTVALFSLKDQISWLMDKTLIIASVMLLIIFLFAVVDVFIVRKQYFDGLKMSKQEIKDEMKNMEGDPLIKSKIRQIQMQMARKRMMSSVASADVVITNPTHYAVAIKYDDSKAQAPIVVAKGMDFVALQIKKIAYEHNVEVVSNPPLARELYAKVDLDKEISSDLFAAVAEVLAYVYKMNKK